MDITCPSCGAPEALLGPATFISLHDTDVGGLARLLHGRLDVATCGTCRKPLGVTPTVIVLDDFARTVHYAVGDLLADPDALKFEDWSARFRWPPLPGRSAVTHLVQYADLATLADAVGRILAADLVPVRDMLVATAAGEAGFIERRWRDFTSRTTVALELATAAQVSRLADVLEIDGIHGNARLGSFAALVAPFADPGQAEAAARLLLSLLWYQLADYWTHSRDGVEPHTLEADLRRYVDAHSLWRSDLSYDVVLAELAKLAEPEPQTFLTEYVRQSIRASIAQAAGQPNAANMRWAAHFMLFETFGWPWNPQESSDELLARRIDADRAKATIDYDAAWAGMTEVLAQLNPQGTVDIGPEGAALLAHLAERVGHPRLAENVFYETVAPEPLDDISLPAVLARLESEVRDRGLAMALAVSEPVARALLDAGAFEHFAAIGDLFSRYAQDDEQRLMAETWAATWLNRARRPLLALQRLGSAERDRDRRAPASLRMHAARIRANAHSLLGDSATAADLLDRSLAESGGDADRTETVVTTVNLARELKETGRPDRALRLLEEVTADGAGFPPDPDLLLEFAITYAELGDAAQALSSARAALALTGRSRKKPEVQLVVAILASQLGERDEALQMLVAAGPDGHQVSDAALLAEAGALANLSLGGAALPADLQARVSPCLQRLRSEADAAAQRGNHSHAQPMLERAWYLASSTGHDDADALAAMAYAAAHQRRTPVNSSVLVALAHDAYRKGRRRRARQLLSEMVEVTAQQTGEVIDLGSFAEHAVHERSSLAAIAGTLAAAGRWQRNAADLRLVMELQRDQLLRARMMRQAPYKGVPFHRMLADAKLRRLAAKGDVAVLEWIAMIRPGAAYGEHQAVLTVVSRRGRVRVHPFDIEDTGRLTLGEVELKLQTRLDEWIPGAPGDPFAVDGWAGQTEQVVAHLRKHLRPGAHVVVLPLATWPRLPWHVPIQQYFTCSYAPSWTSLLALPHKPSGRTGDVGIVHVPRYREDGTVRTALAASAARTLGRQQRTRRVTIAEGASCDAAAVARLIASNSVVKLLCHGFVDVGQRDVGIVVAAGGILPLADSAADREAFRPHKMGWRMLQNIEHPAQVVFSTACSSGLSHNLGNVQALGLFTPLRAAGTHALVAPRWDVAAGAIGILDDALESYLDGRPLAEALRTASLDAYARGMPANQAFAYALEGDWR